MFKRVIVGMLHSFCAVILTGGCFEISAMHDTESRDLVERIAENHTKTALTQKHNQDDSVFGTEVLPETTIESKYGKLTFTAISVPYFAKGTDAYDCVLYVRDKLKQISSDPLAIASFQIMSDFCKNMSPLWLQGEQFFDPATELCANCEEFKEFWYATYISLRSRLFERGMLEDYGIGYFFGRPPFLRLFCPLFRYNNCEVSNSVLLAVGYYLESLYEYSEGVRSNSFLPADYRRVLMEKIDKTPKLFMNVLAWVFEQASKDMEAQNEMQSQQLLLFGFFPPDPIVLNK